MNIFTPTVENASELLTYFTKLVEIDTERVERPEDVAKITLEAEQKWIESLLIKQEQGSMIIRCVRDTNNQIVGLGEIERRPRWIEQHVGEIRFGLMLGNREAGIALVHELEGGAKRLGIKMLYYFHLRTQVQGLDVMNQCGYVEAGIISNYYYKNGDFIDRVFLQKSLNR